MRTEGDGDRRAGRRESAFFRLGAFAVRRRRSIILIWILVVVAAFPFLGKLSGRLSQGGFEVPGSQSDQVKQALQHDFHRSNLTDTLVMHSDSLTARAPDFLAAFGRVRAALLKAPDVESLSDPYA